MRDPISNEGSGRWRRRLLEVDGWIDSTLYDLGRGAGEGYERVRQLHGPLQGPRVSRGDLRARLGIGHARRSRAPSCSSPSPSRPSTRSAATGGRQSEFSVTFLDRYGNVIGKRGILQDDSVELEELPDNLIKAVLATEDRRFFDHFGIDVFGTFRALRENARAGGVVQGGSSITQQLAKNLFLSNERTLQRKIKEAYLALWLEANLTKREILKLYLDRAYMGGGTFGVGGCGRFLFRQAGAGSRPRGIGNACGAIQGADPLRAAHQSAGGARARQ